MTKSHICEAACHIRDNEYKDIRQSDFASLLTMSTLISLSSLGTGGGRSPFCVVVYSCILLYEKFFLKRIAILPYMLVSIT